MLSRTIATNFYFKSTDYCKNALKVTTSYKHSCMSYVIYKWLGPQPWFHKSPPPWSCGKTSKEIMAEYTHAIVFWNPRAIVSWCARFLTKIRGHQQIRESCLILHLWSTANHSVFGTIKCSALYPPGTSCCMLVLYACVWQTCSCHSKSWRLELYFLKLSRGQVENVSMNYGVRIHHEKGPSSDKDSKSKWKKSAHL